MRQAERECEVPRTAHSAHSLCSLVGNGMGLGQAERNHTFSLLFCGRWCARGTKREVPRTSRSLSYLTGKSMRHSLCRSMGNGTPIFSILHSSFSLPHSPVEQRQAAHIPLERERQHPRLKTPPRQASTLCCMTV